MCFAELSGTVQTFFQLSGLSLRFVVARNNLYNIISRWGMEELVSFFMFYPGSSHNGHSRKLTVLLITAFTKPRSSQLPCKSVFLHSSKRPASVMDTFFVFRGCLLMSAFTVFSS